MVIIDDKEYDPAELTPHQQMLVSQVNNCRNKAQTAKMDLQIAQVAEKQFIDALVASVKQADADKEAAA